MRWAVPTTARDDAAAIWLAFCHRLHEELATHLSDAVSIRERVTKLLPRNSFAESCFTKGCVLPIVDTVTTSYLTGKAGASRSEVRQALRCEGFETPLYSCAESQVGFSSHSRSNSYHPGDKSGRRSQSRRSPDFCIRHASLPMVGELKYVSGAGAAATSKVVHDLLDYLSVSSEPTSDWGHDFGYGLVYDFSGDTPRRAEVVLDHWETDRIFISRYLPS